MHEPSHCAATSGSTLPPALTSLDLDRHRALERARVEAGEGPWPALVELVNVLPDRVQILHKLLVQALRLFEFPLPAQQS